MSQQGSAIMAKEPINKTDWAEVAAKAQALLVLSQAGLGEKKLTDKARFLMVLGLSRAHAAALLGSTDESLRVSFGRESRKGTSGAGKPSEDAA
jgi:hypothetical protein